MPARPRHAPHAVRLPAWLSVERRGVDRLSVERRLSVEPSVAAGGGPRWWRLPARRQLLPVSGQAGQPLPHASALDHRGGGCRGAARGRCDGESAPRRSTDKRSTPRRFSRSTDNHAPLGCLPPSGGGGLPPPPPAPPGLGLEPAAAQEPARGLGGAAGCCAGDAGCAPALAAGGVVRRPLRPLWGLRFG